MGKSLYLRQKQADHLFGISSFAIPSKYFALFKGDPEGVGSEVLADDYARLATSSSDWAAADSSATIYNSAIIEFDETTNEWSTVQNPITHFAVFDAETAGNMLASGALQKERAVAAGTIVRFVPGSISYQET